MIRLQGDRSTYLFDPANTRTCLRPNGRFSIIYLGKDEKDGATVIVKQLHPRLRRQLRERRRFMKEFHPFWDMQGITRTLDMIITDEDLYLIREYREGLDLQSWIEQGHFDKLRSAAKRDFVLNLLELVAGLHRNGQLHGDIKPSNFIIGPSGEVSLIDLGLAMPLDKRERPSRDASDPLPFSMLYSPPELMLNFPDLLDERSDVFSMGIVLYQLMSGEMPWDEKNPAVLMNLQLVYPIARRSVINRGLFSIIEKMTARYAFPVPPLTLPEDEQREGIQTGMEKRFANLEEVKKELDTLLNFQWKKRKWLAFFLGK